MKANIGVVSLVFSGVKTSFFAKQDANKQDILQLLSENGFIVRAQKHNALHSQENARKAVRRFAPKQKTETLAQRLARQRKEKEEKEPASKEASGILTGLTSYFW